MYRYNLMVLLSILISYSEPVHAENPVLLYYFERAPYAITDNNGGVSGLVATPAADAFKKAGIPFQWKKMPFKRQLETIKYNKKKGCGIGWFKTTEREEFARFSESIYQDKPAITISKKGHQTLTQYRDVISLFRDENIKLLVKDGFSYGRYIDEQIKKISPETVVVVNSSNIQMLQMILAGRADYFFVAEEEAQKIVLKAGYDLSQFQVTHYFDIPAGNYRYIGCARQVPQETIDLINNALK